MTTTETAFEGWAILEIMGHRQRPGYVREVEIAGGKMLRVDIPTPGGDVTEFYGVASIYSLRPCSEEIARDHGSHIRAPVKPVAYATLEDRRATEPPRRDAFEDEDDDFREVEQ